ncbi:Acetyltransferase (isoleucine patch superfamily) [Terribacillus halophilus]|uniref:Acetyltransferase (Isoleucine patch superfamily) n=1 Tax=Terribacillus halophilus TaxID=361279 RepID=A0A1G6IKR4_9BACI|nr:acyltransferase [Terribacillus halophilus]SDC07078.1 Acetyltransferase (isoleucine patch superfamily) [Terribacillus halophilus]
MKRKREIFVKYKRIIDMILAFSRILPKSFYLRVLKVIRGHDNYLAVFIRYICLKNCAKKCGENVAIFSNVYLLNVGELTIGDNVSIHPLSYIDASGSIFIGSNVSIAHNTTILSEEHKYTNLNINIKDQGYIYKKTSIEDNVWIGAGARILAGCTVKTGSIIAAGAVVKKEVRSNAIVGGVPAKVLKERNS